MESWREELYHHGIKGQKWGIRRFQNEDGSLTEAGRERYLNADGEFDYKKYAKDATKTINKYEKRAAKIAGKIYQDKKNSESVAKRYKNAVAAENEKRIDRLFESLATNDKLIEIRIENLMKNKEKIDEIESLIAKNSNLKIVYNDSGTIATVNGKGGTVTTTYSKAKVYQDTEKNRKKYSGGRYDESRKANRYTTWYYV